MPRTIVVAGGASVILAAVVVAVLRSEPTELGGTEREAQSAASTESVAKVETDEAPTPATLPAHASPKSPIRLRADHPGEVRFLSENDIAENEPGWKATARQSSMRLWGWFVDEAALTAEQQRQVMGVLADAQQTLESHATPRDDDSYSPREWLGVKQDLQKLVDDEVDRRMHEILSEEQLGYYQRYISPAHSFLNGSPLYATTDE